MGQFFLRDSEVGFFVGWLVGFLNSSHAHFGETGKKLLSWKIRSLKVPGGVCAFWIARGFSRFAVEQEIFLGLQTQLALRWLSPGLSSLAWGSPGTAGHWALVQHV